jgi:hypothetical protein
MNLNKDLFSFFHIKNFGKIFQIFSGSNKFYTRKREISQFFCGEKRDIFVGEKKTLDLRCVVHSLNGIK